MNLRIRSIAIIGTVVLVGSGVADANGETASTTSSKCSARLSPTKRALSQVTIDRRPR